MSGRLVGREPALAAVGGALDDALAGGGRLTLVTGEAGIGKTAVAREVLTSARARGARVAWSAWPPGGTPAYWPWVQALRALDPDAVEPPLAADRERFELYDGVLRTLDALAADTGAVIVLDDLHWADPASLDLLDVVGRQLGGRRVLVLGTYREVEAPAALQQVAASAEGITLGGLDAEAVGALVTAVTGIRPTQAEAQRVRRRTAGNPLFVRELARLLVAEGTRPSSSMPSTVLDTLQQRLVALPPACRDVLGVVAVADSADPELVAAVSGLDEHQAAALLSDAVMARVLGDAAAAPDRPFAHDLYREAVLAAVPPDEQRRLHGLLAAELIRRHTADPDVPAGRIADHLSAALPARDRDPTAVAEAAGWASRAGDEAMARLGHEDAVRHYRHALALTGPDPERLLALAEAELRAGDPAARERFIDAATAAESRGDADALALAALGLHRVGARGDHDPQLALLTKAVAAVPEGSEQHARLLAARSRELRHTLRPMAECLPVAEAAVHAARTLAHPELLATCLLALHDARWALGTAADRLPVVLEMGAHADAAQDPELAAQARVLVAACRLELNDRQGLADLATYVDQAAALGSARGRWEAATRAATLALITGDLDTADDRAEEGLALGTAIGLPDAMGVHGTLVWPLSQFDGTRQRRIESWLRIDGVPMRDAFAAAAWRTGGDREEARRIARTLSLDQLPPSRYDLEMDALAADALAAAGDTEEARRSYAHLLPHAGTNVVVGGCASYWGPVDLYLGHLAAGLGRAESARTHYDHAARMAGDLGAPRWAALAERLRDDFAPDPSETPVLRSAAGVWTVSWQGRSDHLPDSKGLRDLALLVASPGRDVAAVQLAGGTPAGGADPVLDARAKRDYQRRIDELGQEIEGAEQAGDAERSERARGERSALVAELATAVGLGGRDRRLGDDAERARKAVTARIRDAIGRISSVHPELGEHLAGAVRTGSWCGYHPG